MVLSFWRYNHLILAFISTLFLVVASVTGVILACEPISNRAQAFSIDGLENIPTAVALTQLKEEYKEVFSIEITANQEVIASVVTKSGKNENIYINPRNASKLGILQDRNPIFIWTTNLHRSLFLKGIGRFFVGFVSLLLCLIAISGLFLLAQRQGGFLKLYSKIKESDFNQRYHVVLGRWLLIPLIIIAATGVYLSLITFDLIPAYSPDLDWSKEPSQVVTSGKISENSFFKQLPLDEVRSINFPFSTDEFDYYEVNLKDRDLLVHQYSGEIISELEHPFSFLLSRWSYNLHTGTGSILWSLILLISSASILFFVFSGFAIYLKRKRNTKQHLVIDDKDTSEIVILVGSEGGSTYAFAKALAQQLSHKGKSIYLSSLNQYTAYPKATQLLILTATYGDGDAPTNARHFIKKLAAVNQPNHLQYAVVGFGSKDYEHYCRFAEVVDQALRQKDQFSPLLELEKINEHSQDEINSWLHNYSLASGIALKKDIAINKSREYMLLEIIERSPLNIDDTFILKLKTNKNLRVQSGDILQILAPNVDKARAYSIACINNEILLSVKLHQNGICSSYLSKLAAGDHIKGYVEENPHFHLSKDETPVVYISNGTGIAPFLGMINHNDSGFTSKNQYLFWGGKFKESFDIYKPFIEKGTCHLDMCQLATSRDLVKTYVQDELWAQKELLINVLHQNGTIMICGSIAMRDDVLNVLEKIMEQELKIPLSEFEIKGQILTDCY